MDLVAGIANYLAIDADKESERLYNPLSHELEDILLLMDAGYFDLDYCHDVDKRGGFYVIRASSSINPEISKAFDEQGQPIKALAGKKLKSMKLQ